MNEFQGIVKKNEDTGNEFYALHSVLTATNTTQQNL